MERVAIIGGGITGMAAADSLSQHGIACTLYEQESSLGGLAGSFAVNGAQIERFYHHLFTSDTTIAGLIEDLGLGDDLEWRRSVTAYYAVGLRRSARIRRLAGPLDVLRFSPLPMLDRFRLGMLAVVPRLVQDWHPLERMTAEEWLVRWGGHRVYEEVWAPLLRAKFGSHAEQISAVWIWNKLKLRGGSRGRGQEERLGYLRGGFGRVLVRWEEKLAEQGVDVRHGSRVEEIRIAEDRASGVVAQGQFEPYSKVLVTTAPEILLHIAAGLPPDFRRRLSRIRYMANSCLVLKLREALGKVYWLNINDPSIPFVALVEHTNLQPLTEYGGSHLVYLSRYMDASDPIYEMSTDQMWETYRPGLRKLFPNFEDEWLEEMWSWRERYTQPLILREYSQIRPSFRTPVRDLWLCCMAQVYPEDRGMNYALEYGRKVVLEMVGEEL
jgi:protoporphyrinogen oxidase